MKKKWLQSLIAVMMAVCLSACSVPAKAPVTDEQEEANRETTVEKPNAEAGSGKEIEVMAVAAPSFVTEENGYTPLTFNTNAPAYTIAEDLSNIENIDQFPNLSDEQRAMIAKNGFVVMPTDAEQLFYIYEENTYKTIPNFVTTDSVLQLYHIYYDYSLRNVESNFFYEDTAKMNDAILRELLEESGKVTDDRVNTAMQRVIGYFAVADLLLDVSLPENLDEETRELAKQEYDLITEAGETVLSPIAGIKIDYTLFTVRGHYTRSEELTKYFLAFSWYGVVPFVFYESGERNDDNALCAMIMADALKNTPEAEEIWNNIYATTSFMVGESDDLTPCEIAGLIEQIYGKIPAPDELPGKLDDFYTGLKDLRSAQIVSKQESASTDLQMRFMGQRYIADSEILQELSDPDDRPFPTGVDVFAVYGSERAEALLDEIYRPEELWAEYRENFDKLADKFRNQTIEEKTSNAYNGWLFALNEIAETKGEGYPLFMQNEAWMNKSLTTALGSWAELRHDTILYGKQSGAECGGGEEPPEVMGYVEPDPEFFHRLIWLTETTMNGLDERGLLSNEMKYKTETMLNMLNFLENCAVKELNGEDLNAEERYTLLVYGGTLEYISSSIAETDGWYLIESDTDRNMAVIADVHTTLGGYLNEGVGHACEIYVAIPQNGKVYLTRGAVFDYYEFTSTERLTDEEWQKIIRENPPERVPFVGTFMDENIGEPVPLPDAPYSTGC